MMALSYDQVRIAAQGRWKDFIFPAFAIDVPAKANQHAPCPICGGKDRFRCDDKNGHGSFICNQCGSGDGFKLVALARNMDNKKALQEVAQVLGITESRKISDEERQRWRVEHQKKLQLAEQEKQKGYQNAQKIAMQLWQSLAEHTQIQSPYLTKKRVQNHGCKIKDNGNLIVPMLDITGQLWNVQEIHTNGFKSFIKGGCVNHCFHTIGDLHNDSEIICIVEGYATGASVYEATGYPTIVTFNTSNLPKVAVEIFKKYPHSLLVYCADDDCHSTPPDAGLKAAKKALAETGGIIVLPDFSIVGDI